MKKLTAFVELDDATIDDLQWRLRRLSRTPLPDGRDCRRTYLAHLRELETEAKAARRGAWGKTQP
jgi:hypothetical protein